MEAENILTQSLIHSLHERGKLTNPAMKAAFTAVPRHLFLPRTQMERVYTDESIPICQDAQGEIICSATMPSMIIRVLDQLDLHPGHNVLEIGAGTGYTAALLRELVGNAGKITTIEIEREIADMARDNLLRASVGDVNVVHADGVAGYAPRAAYDRILSSVGVWDISPAWIRQLKPDGRLVVPMWLDGLQVTAAFRLEADGTLYGEDASPSAFVYMRGAGAGPTVRKRIGPKALILIADEVDRIDSVALHLLLSDDEEDSRLTVSLNTCDYWYGFLPYMMLHEAPDDVFALYDVIAGQQAYGIKGEGFMLFMPGSACFVPYYGLGLVQNFGGADAFLAVESYLESWQAAGRPGIDRLRMRLIPHEQGEPSISSGKIYNRRDHYLHVWFENDVPT